MTSRHKARRLALQGLCCLDVQGDKSLDLVEDFIEDSKESGETIATARKLTQAVLADRDECDQLLSRHARHWKLTRLALVDRNILRLAVHEIRANPNMFKVAISEATNLAQEFSTAQSPRFVNGVLDAVAKELLNSSRQG